MWRLVAKHFIPTQSHIIILITAALALNLIGPEVESVAATSTYGQSLYIFITRYGYVLFHCRHRLSASKAKRVTHEEIAKTSSDVRTRRNL